MRSVLKDIWSRRISDLNHHRISSLKSKCRQIMHNTTEHSFITTGCHFILWADCASFSYWRLSPLPQSIIWISLLLICELFTFVLIMPFSMLFPFCFIQLPPFYLLSRCPSGLSHWLLVLQNRLFPFPFPFCTYLCLLNNRRQLADIAGDDLQPRIHFLSQIY